MDSIRIVLHIGILYLFYYTGVWIQQVLNSMIPGSIIGMLLLFCCFCLKVLRPEYVEKGAGLLLTHMPLLFLPVTAGVMAHFEIFSGSGFWLVILAFFSTWCVMLVSGWTVQLMMKRRELNE